MLITVPDIGAYFEVVRKIAKAEQREELLEDDEAGKRGEALVLEVQGGERVMVLDFGIAKLSSVDGKHKTRTGAVVGTPAYMSPEQAVGGREPDEHAATDRDLSIDPRL